MYNVLKYCRILHQEWLMRYLRVSTQPCIFISLTQLIYLHNYLNWRLLNLVLTPIVYCQSFKIKLNCMLIHMVYIVGTINTIIDKGSQPAYNIKAVCAANHHTIITAKNAANKETK